MTLDAWVVRTRPSRAATCVPTVCVLSLHPPTAAWHFGQPPSDVPLDGAVDWKLRGRKGEPVRVTFVRSASGTPHAIGTAALPEWPHAVADSSASAGGGCQSIPFLKSHLQKCVRKGLALKAVATAKQLLKLNVVECVRRLAVIMVEDVALHPQAMGVLLWWTVVLAHRLKERGRGATLRCVDVPLWLCEWLLGLVHVLCAHPVFVRLPNVLPHATPWQRLLALDPMAPPTDDRAATSASAASHRATLCSLYLRATYGGLKGDVALLEQAAEALCRGDTDGLIRAPVRAIVWDSVSALPADAWDLDAIDFHVVPRLFELVERGDRDRNRPPIEACEGFDWKRMMWENGSMTNQRENVVVAGGSARKDGGGGNIHLYGCEVWAEWLPRARPLQRWLVRKSYEGG